LNKCYAWWILFWAFQIIVEKLFFSSILLAMMRQYQVE
jgi:hypothetical protein